jgi:hypothetical protein
MIRKVVTASLLMILVFAIVCRADISPGLARWMALAEDGDRVAVWVFLSDKGDYSRDRLDAMVEEIAVSFDPRAIERRIRQRPENPFDEHDLPLFRPYVKVIEGLGVEFRAFSKWLNAVSIVATGRQIRQIADLDFVTMIRRVSGRTGAPMPVTHPVDMRAPYMLDQYGYAFRQLDQIQVTTLHSEGYTGDSVCIAIFDTGFWLEHESLSGLNLIAQHDFINDDDQTANEPGDPEYQHYHGTMCLSLLAANSPGIMMGAAYNAEYILAKTEDTSMEQPIEEDWWIEAAEWADSLGAQIISSSLCYKDWYTYEDMDGDTAPITIAADMAALNGIVVANAAGNSGAAAWRYIIAPADGDSVVTVGSVDSTGVRSHFSSQGPTYDGRIKPTIMANGQATFIADPAGTDAYRRGDGTSFATPLAAGAIGLILQKNPDWDSEEVLEGIMLTGTQASNPDTLCGWGILQAHAASNYLTAGTGISGPVQPLIAVYPNPSRSSFFVRLDGMHERRSVRVYDIRGRLLGRLSLEPSRTAEVDLGSVLPDGGAGVFFIDVSGAGRTKVVVVK